MKRFTVFNLKSIDELGVIKTILTQNNTKLKFSIFLVRKVFSRDCDSRWNVHDRIYFLAMLLVLEQSVTFEIESG